MAKRASNRFIAAVMLALFCSALLFCWPGSLSFDPTVQWYEARTAVVTSQHPPFMSFVWHFLDRVVPGPGLLLALELTLFWASVGFLLSSITISRLTVVLSAIFFAIQPFVIAHSALVLKDVLSGNFALLGFAVLFHYQKSTNKRAILVCSFALFVFAGLVRYQMFLFIAPAIVSVFLFERYTLASSIRVQTHYVVVAIVACCMTFVAARTAMSTTLDLRPHFFDIQLRQAMDFDIASVLAREPNAKLEIFSATGIDVPALRARAQVQYTPYTREPLSEGNAFENITDRIPMETLRNQWLALLRATPGIFVEHRIDAFARLMGVGNIYSCWPLNTVGFLGQPTEYWNKLNGRSLRPSAATRILKTRLFPAGTMLFRPITYLILSIAIFAISLRIRDDVAIFVLGMICASWLYWLTFIPLPLSCEVRYSYAPCMMALFAFVYWAARRFEQFLHTRGST